MKILSAKIDLIQIAQTCKEKSCLPPQLGLARTQHIMKLVDRKVLCRTMLMKFILWIVGHSNFNVLQQLADGYATLTFAIVPALWLSEVWRLMVLEDASALGTIVVRIWRLAHQDERAVDWYHAEAATCMVSLVTLPKMLPFSVPAIFY
jgi:hypothetical protein